MRFGLSQKPAAMIAWVGVALLMAWCIGMFGRGYWTPDEPREADIAWRMSWQADKAVPLLAGEPFCEKPPLTYWLAAMPIGLLGEQAWIARLPNLLYAMITALAVGLLASRSTGRFAGLVAAACISTFLLSYQVAIWLATDAPLLASVSVALLGAYVGFYASAGKERLRGYLLMHAALAVGFLSKSAVAWMVPAMAILTLSIWERRWRELLRWELYAGLLIQAAIILPWVWFVYRGDDGPQHLKTFFWNNLVGRFASVDAPPDLQYASGHRNSPGKYLIELPMYLFPWTLLVIAAGRRAWRQRRISRHDNRAVRFAIAASLPPLILLSLAATARNIYFAPALPGIALLVAWWAREILPGPDPWDVRALRATAALLLLGVVVFVAALILVGADSWSSIPRHWTFIAIAGIGLLVTAFLSARAWAAAGDHVVYSQWALLLAYCALLIGPASQLYRQVDTWQDLAKIGRAVERSAAGRPLILLAPDETTRAVIDMYARTAVDSIPGPLDAAGIERVRTAAAAAAPDSLFLVQLAQRSAPGLPWRATPQEPAPPAWIEAATMQPMETYSAPHGRRYALLRFRR
ncbi:MAG TPA: glycosyltransferase family 39 protein [Steroidobacteraceae bacterium]|jgi:4-amino-4-deoxy-L-arabinose transferase-like glycosyltransferase|nr:glycosyltransferase family 39 protein [Steroidobacteraceae bacterium]